MKKWYWSLALFVVGTIVGSKAAIVSNTNLVVKMAVGTTSGFLIGSFLGSDKV